MSEAQIASLMKYMGPLGCVEIIVVKRHWRHDMQLSLNASVVVIFHIVMNHLN